MDSEPHTPAPVTAAEETSYLEQMHDLVRQLREEGVPITFLTHKEPDGQPPRITLTNIVSSGQESGLIATCTGYQEAIDYLANWLSSRREG